MITEDAVAVPSAHPLTACHVVVAPVRHVETFYDLDVQEQQAVWALVQEIRMRISASLRVEAFYVGFADGGHAHVHVVPRGQVNPSTCPAGIEWVDPDR